MPEDARRHAVGVEEVEVGDLLAGRREDHRAPHDAARRQHRAAARVVVELGDDDARELERLVEGPRREHGVLAGHRVDHEEGVVRRRWRR